MHVNRTMCGDRGGEGEKERQERHWIMEKEKSREGSQ